MQMVVSNPRHLFCTLDNVHLLAGGVSVGTGVVFTTNPKDTCHLVALGEWRICVQVKEAYFPLQILPYPHDGAELLGEAIDSYVLWDWSCISLLGEVPTTEPSTPATGNEFQDEDGTVGHDGVDLGMDEATIADDGEDLGMDDEFCQPIEEQGGSHDASNTNPNFCDRSNWYKAKVDIYSSDRKMLLALGSITAWQPTAAVNNELLGEDHVGVLVLNLLGDADTSKQAFPGFVDGYACLVKWPIISLKLRACNEFLDDILISHVVEDIQNEGNILEDGGGVVSNLLLEKPKRHYSMGGKRNEADPNKRQKQQVQKRRNKKLNEEAVIEACMTKCKCGLDCCRTFPRTDIEEIREDFYGFTSDEKTTELFTLFENREVSMVEKGQMLLRGRTICKTAFWTIMGICQSTFYDHEKRHKAGCKVGFHGNKGTKKPRPSTNMFRAHLTRIVETLGEPMPHLRYIGENGTSNIIYRLPSCYTKDIVYNEVIHSMNNVGLSPISKVSFYRMWRESFGNYSFHKNSAFAKCMECTTLKERLMKERRSEVRSLIEKQREKHMQEQMSRRQIYYAARLKAEMQPSELLCLIHDKMDQGKTQIPKLQTQLKNMPSGSQPLPIALIGMLAHGQQPEAFAHFIPTGLYSPNPNVTISSLAKQFRDLETYQGDKSGDLLWEPKETTKPIFKALLDKEAFQIGYLNPKGYTIDRYKGHPETPDDQVQNFEPDGLGENASATQEGSFRKLPKHLHLQLDNSGKDNKNWAVMTYCSELVLRGVFQSIVMSFLMVGHTHEDVDAMFSRVSTRLAQPEVATLHALMAEVWESEAIHPVPRVIEEIADYKAYASPFVKTIEGQSIPVAFLFTMKNNVPVYQVKESINSPWTPPQGRTMWKEDSDKKLILPTGEPSAVQPFEKYKQEDKITPFIKTFVEWLRNTWRDETSQGYLERFPLMRHWGQIHDILKKPFPTLEDGAPPAPLLDGFWPCTNHNTGYKSDLGSYEATGWESPLDIVQLEHELQTETLEAETIFVGARSEKERDYFVPLRDIGEGLFIFVRPADNFEELRSGCFWMGKALTKVETRGHPNAGSFKVEWWRPKSAKRSIVDHDRYEGCLEKSKTWECTPNQEEEWCNATAAMHFWKYRGKSFEKGVKIPRKILDQIKECLARANTEEPSS